MISGWSGVRDTAVNWVALNEKAVCGKLSLLLGSMADVHCGSIQIKDAPAGMVSAGISKSRTIPRWRMRMG